MYQFIVKFFVISLCLINKLVITGEATTQDWSMLLRKPYDKDPIEERNFFHDTEPQEPDEDANNPCPLAKNGENARQPWDVNSVRGISKPWLDLHSSGFNNINNEKYNEQEPGQESSGSNCKDDTSDVVIKILFNREEPCDKKKTVLQFDKNSQNQVFSRPGVNVNISNTHSDMWKK